LKKRRPADRFKGCASTGPVQNKAVLKSRLDWKKAEMRDICRGMLDGHGGHLRIRNGGGKTPAQFRRFSSSTPARLADGLGSKRLSLADGRCAPKTWVPRSRRITGLGNDIDSLPAIFCQATRRICLAGKNSAMVFHRVSPAKGDRFVQHGRNSVVDGRVQGLDGEQLRQGAGFHRQIQVPAANGPNGIKAGARGGHVNEVQEAGAQQGQGLGYVSDFEPGVVRLRGVEELVPSMDAHAGTR